MNDTIDTTEQKKDKGFTLIELLIVIVILGILATVTVFAVSGITNQGQDSACQADLKTLEVAIEAYNAQQGTYPANTGVLSPGFLRSAPGFWIVVAPVGDAPATGNVALRPNGEGFTNPCTV